MSFATKLVLLVLGISALYAAVFSHLVYISLIEQVFSPHTHLPRYAGPVHYHNSVEWLLLIFPMVMGWAGVVISLRYLIQRWFRSS